MITRASLAPQGHSASWHLDHVIILNCKTDESFLFPCRQWFDTRIGDGLVERRLGAGDAMGKITNYTFKITTSDIRGAGTVSTSSLLTLSIPNPWL